MFRCIISLITCLLLITANAKSQCRIKDYQTYKYVLKVDGDYVVNYSNYKKLYKFDGDYLIDYNNYKKLLKFDGNYII